MDIDPVNTKSLNAHTESSITNLSLYGDRARITRLFKVNITSGQNKLTLTTLPNVIDHDSLRIEGRGPAIIQGVTSFKTPLTNDSSRTAVVDDLQRNLDRARDSLARAEKVVKSIDGYMEKLDVESLDISKLGQAMDVFDSTGQMWNDKIRGISEEIQTITKQIQSEASKGNNAATAKKLRSVVVIDLFAHESADIDIVLNYTVSHASWESAYDVRVDSADPTSTVNLVYKALISQETGEDWINAPITLETSQPTFGVELPKLSPWNVSHTSTPGKGLGRGGAFRHRKIMPDPDDMDYMLSDNAVITSKGSINATFRVPGLTTIRSTIVKYDDDDLEEDEQRQRQKRTVIVASLNLEKELSWVCVPKGDPRVHMTAKIKNESEYTFLPGSCDVYVDQSYVARIEMDSVSPKEVFYCPLGLDPSIRVTYHPCSKFISTSGFLSKVTTHSFTQTITIHNTKNIPIHKLKVLEHVPVSTDEEITVKLVNPALPIPSLTDTSYALSSLIKQIDVVDGVIARWRRDDEASDAQLTTLGKDGQVEWICAIDECAKVNLSLHWELSTAGKGTIYGLTDH